MTIQGVSHLTFIVRDLERTAALFCQALGALEVYDSKNRQFSLSREKFFCSVVFGWRLCRVNQSSVRTAMSRLPLMTMNSRFTKAT